MRTVAVIPARMGSTRYPGKPLCDIHGLPMIEHVYRRTRMSDSLDATYVGTPNEEIKAGAEAFGAPVIMTGEHTRCTSRVAEAAEGLDADIVVVMQGDEPLIRPEMVDTAVEPMLDDPDIGCVNLASRIRDREVFEDENTVKVVLDGDDRALYFSREPIPNLHDVAFEDARVYEQVCAMPFRTELLQTFVELPETPLERAESIDMLRLLEHGFDVDVVETDVETHAVDTPADHERVNEMMAGDDLFAEYAPREA